MGLQRVGHDLVTEQPIQGVRFALCYITSAFNYPKTAYCTNIMGKVIFFFVALAQAFERLKNKM